MSPAIFRWKGYRFFFFSREETRPHVFCSEGEAKFWIEPEVELGRNHGMSASQLREVRHVLEERKDEIAAAWRKHFDSGSEPH